MLRIHDILVWIRIRIRIRGSIPLANGSGSGSCYFHHWPSRRQQKTTLKKSFSAHYFLKAYLHNFLKIKSQKDVTKQYKSRVFLLILLNDPGSGSTPLTNGNGSGSRRPKIIWFRIRNTGHNTVLSIPPFCNKKTAWQASKSFFFFQFSISGLGVVALTVSLTRILTNPTM